MNTIKPMLPCPSIRDQVSFYESLGFKTIQIYTRPSPYAVVQYGAVELHFYGTKRILPTENPQMCYLEVDDVNLVYEEFTTGLKKNLGRIPRAGIPRISKLKHLADDRRFMLTDLGGNTFYVGTPNAKLGSSNFYRTLESTEHAANFELLYDLMYSKEDSHAALNMLDKHFPADITSLPVEDLDLAKILLVALDIHIQQDHVIHPHINDRLNELIYACDTENSDWKKISQQYENIISDE